MLKPVYALVGEDSFLQLQKLGEIFAQAPGDAQRADLDGETAQLADVLDELRSFAMFGGHKLVVVRNGDAFITRFRDQLEDYVASPSDSATLVLRANSLPANQRIHKLIAKAGVVEKCEPPKDLAKWIVERGRTSHKITLSPPAAQVLAERIGGDLGKLDNELAKLALSKEDGKIEAEDVSKGVTFQREQEMWDMTNALASGNSTEALRRWRQLLQTDSSSEFRAVTWLGMWLEKAHAAAKLKQQRMDDATICKIVKVFPWDIQKPFMQTVTALGERRIAQAINELTTLDRRSKTGLSEATRGVESFILSFAKKPLATNR